MYFFEGNYSDSGGSGSLKLKNLTGLKIATVMKTGTIKPNLNDSAQRKRDERFNSDPYIIRCKIIGSNSDNTFTDDILPNCLPLMPKHNAIIPKEGETVLIFEYGIEGDAYPERFYIGPIISTLTRLNYQTLYSGSIAGTSISPLNISEDINTLPDTKGVFSEYDKDYNYSIDGRDNSDITFKPSEILIRGGKFIKNGDNVSMNKVNPAFVQIKHGFTIKKDSKTNNETVSATNIVANKINLLTYGATANPEFNLTKRDDRNNKTPYIDDEEFNKILETAHPLVFGDILMDYLMLLEQAFLNHNHNHLGLSVPIQGNPVISKFISDAPKLREKMLSKNIKIN